MTTPPFAAAMSVTIGGVAYPLPTRIEASDCLAPEVDQATIEFPWGDRIIRGASAPSELLPAYNAEVVITSGSWTWRGYVTRRARCATGGRRSLRVVAQGPSNVLDKSYLGTFARDGLSGVVQTPGGPRFAPGTRSAAASGPGGTYYLQRLGGNWTVGTALSAFLAHAEAYAGLPSIARDDGATDLTRILSDTECDGISCHASLQGILGHRMGIVWRCFLDGSGWKLRLRSSLETGHTVDLTTGLITDYDVGEDVSAALASLEVRGAFKQYAFSIDSYTSGSGDLVQGWTSGDVADRAAGNLSSPAFRRFRLAVFALPDGSPSVTANALPSLPINANTTLLPGSAPWQIFAQKTSGGSWISLAGICSVMVSNGDIWIEGIDPAQWATWDRIRLTLCLSPRAALSASHTGGVGMGHGLSIVGTRHAHATSASIAVSGSSLADVDGDVYVDQDPIDEEADALWSTLGVSQLIASWTVDNQAGGGLDPGDHVTLIKLPVPGSSPTDVTCDAIVSNRLVSWSRGRARTTWQIMPRPFSRGAIYR